MKDEYLTVAPKLTAAESAVSYVLQRIRVDANLRWHMLGTEAFARLCKAEAERTGKSEDEIRNTYSAPAPHAADDLPKLVIVRRTVEKVLRQCREHLLQASPWGASVVDELEQLT